MELVNTVWDTLRSGFSFVPHDLPTLFFKADPLWFASVLVTTLIVGVFILSNLMQNYSQVDRLWSLLPPALVLFYWYRNTINDPRLTIMAILVTLWGIRLTFNFWRKGGYYWKDEDYRWQPLKATIQPWPLWQLFNLFFISIFQLVLLFLISSPIHIAYRHAGEVKFGTFDALLLFAHLALLLCETIADEQQWNFQTEKYRRIENGLPLSGDYRSGFLTSGLFQFSRHPAFVCEISMWWVFYLFGVSASDHWINWTLVGPVLLTLLFQGSTSYTEKLTSEKYKDYSRYQLTTSRLLPWIPGPSIHEQHHHAHATTAVTSSDPESPMSRIKKPKTNSPSSPKGSHPKSSSHSVAKNSVASPKTSNNMPEDSTKDAKKTAKSPSNSHKASKASAASKPSIGSPKRNGKSRPVIDEEESSSEEEIIRSNTKSPKKKSSNYVSSLPVSPKGKSRK